MNVQTPNTQPLAVWVKHDMYLKMTGHTTQTIKRLRLDNIIQEGIHWRRGLEGPHTFYYNHAAIDALLTGDSGDSCSG